MDIQNFLDSIIISIENMGYISFAVIILIDIILWRINALLGLLGFILTLAYLLNWI